MGLVKRNIIQVEHLLFMQTARGLNGVILDQGRSGLSYHAVT